MFFSLEGSADESWSWSDGAGVASFAFDRQESPAATNGHSSEVVWQGPSVPATIPPVASPVAMTGPTDEGTELIDVRHFQATPLLVYPTLVPDAQALSIIRKQTAGPLVNQEQLAWVRQSWIQLYDIRTDFTTKAGPRKELRFAANHGLFETITGGAFHFKLPKSVQSLEYAGPRVVAIRPRVAPAAIIDESVQMWNEYCGIKDKATAKRRAARVGGTGCPRVSGPHHQRRARV